MIYPASRFSKIHQTVKLPPLQKPTTTKKRAYAPVFLFVLHGTNNRNRTQTTRNPTPVIANDVAEKKTQQKQSH